MSSAASIDLAATTPDAMPQPAPLAEQLRTWNEAAFEDAVEAILPCNGSRAWAAGVATRRPLASAAALSAAADQVWASLQPEDRQQAFDSHPRLGEQHATAATLQSLRWSAGEQNAATPDDAARTALALGNKAYEARFGRIFLVCATGKSAAELLGMLERRMQNEPDIELGIAGEEQRKITQLRLHKWLHPQPAPTVKPGGKVCAQ